MENNNKNKFLKIVVALYPFEAQTPEELTFKKGEKLNILEHPKHDPEWWYAENSSGQTGLVPTNYIKV